MQTNLKCFKSDRKFWVIGYGAGHGPLLLRSGKTDEHHTRIDVLILDIRAMEIRSWSEGFEIALVDQAYLRDFRSCPAEMMEPGLNVYAISGKGWKDSSLVESFASMKMKPISWHQVRSLLQIM